MSKQQAPTIRADAVIGEPLSNAPIDRQLAGEGFSLQGVIDTAKAHVSLPAIASRYRQLLVFAHGGATLWKALDKPPRGEHPVDAYSIRRVSAFLTRCNCSDYRFLYPAEGCTIDLRSLGRQLGWHGDSPLGIGINARFGTWFAYRAVVAANTSFRSIADQQSGSSPCNECRDKPCTTHCPVKAVQPDALFNLQVCVRERLRNDSDCALRCAAREACPVGCEHRYDPEQTRYHSKRSLETLRALFPLV